MDVSLSEEEIVVVVGGDMRYTPLIAENLAGGLQASQAKRTADLVSCAKTPFFGAT